VVAIQILLPAGIYSKDTRTGKNLTFSPNVLS